MHGKDYFTYLFRIKSKKTNKVLYRNFSMRTKKYHYKDIQENEKSCHHEFNNVDLSSEKINEENKNHGTMSPKDMKANKGMHRI